ncbi:MAG: amidase [Dehalococcoidia bacterium]
MADTALALTPAYKLAQLIKNKELSPVELVDCFLERISVLNPKLNAFLTVTESEARATAAAAEKALVTQKELPPLHGVPVAIKDLEYTKGIRTTSGSLVYKDFVPDEDSIAVERLRAAGAIILGKTNTPEFGLLGETKNRLGDDCRNPWDTRCTTGGSSGGSAAAIAAGLSPLATGSDSAGSISNPAGFCGVFGIKPTHGRIPLWPPAPDSLLLLDSGPISRTVKDAALMLGIMAGHDSRDPISIREKAPDYLSVVDKPLPKLRMAWSADMGYAKVDSEVRSASEEAARVFETLGCTVEEAAPDIEYPFDIYTPIILADEYVAIGNLLEERPEDLFPESVVEMKPAREVTSVQYVRALNRLWHFQSRMSDFFEKYDILLTPTNVVTAFPVGDAPREIGGQPVKPHWTTFMPFQVCWNLTGYPAASVPCGFSANGLPIGLFIIGRWGQEDVVLAASAAFEQARPWADKIPQIAQF